MALEQLNRQRHLAQSILYSISSPVNFQKDQWHLLVTAARTGIRPILTWPVRFPHGPVTFHTIGMALDQLDGDPHLAQSIIYSISSPVNFQKDQCMHHLIVTTARTGILPVLT